MDEERYTLPCPKGLGISNLDRAIYKDAVFRMGQQGVLEKNSIARCEQPTEFWPNGNVKSQCRNHCVGIVDTCPYHTLIRWRIVVDLHPNRGLATYWQGSQDAHIGKKLFRMTVPKYYIQQRGGGNTPFSLKCGSTACVLLDSMRGPAAYMLCDTPPFNAKAMLVHLEGKYTLTIFSTCIIRPGEEIRLKHHTTPTPNLFNVSYGNALCSLWGLSTMYGDLRHIQELPTVLNVCQPWLKKIYNQCNKNQKLGLADCLRSCDIASVRRILCMLKSGDIGLYHVFCVIANTKLLTIYTDENFYISICGRIASLETKFRQMDYWRHSDDLKGELLTSAILERRWLSNVHLPEANTICIKHGEWTSVALLFFTLTKRPSWYRKYEDLYHMVQKEQMIDLNISKCHSDVFKLLEQASDKMANVLQNNIMTDDEIFEMLGEFDVEFSVHIVDVVGQANDLFLQKLHY